MGHRDLLVTQNLSQPTSNQCSVHLTRSVRRRAASFKSGSRKRDVVRRRRCANFLELRFWITFGLPTNRELIGLVNSSAFSRTYTFVPAQNILNKRVVLRATMGS